MRRHPSTVPYPDHATAATLQVECPTQGLYRDPWPIVVYLLVAGSLFLPMVRRELDTIRWVALCIIVSPWIVTNWRFVACPIMPFCVYLMFLGSLGIRLASTAWSPMPSYTMSRGISLTALFLFLLAFSARVLYSRRLNSVARLFAFLLALYILPGIALLLLGQSTVPWNGNLLWRGGRFCGILGNGNQIGVCVSVCVPIVFALWWERRWQWWFLILFALAAWSLLMSGSRAGALGFLFGIATFYATYYRVTYFVPVAAASLIFLVLLFYGSETVREFVADYATHGGRFDSSIEQVGANRFDRWELGWTCIKRHPVLGQGYGIGGVSASMSAEDVRISSDESIYGYALHNSFLQTWQEDGIIGLLLLVGIVIAIVMQVLRLSKAVEPNNRALWSGVAGGCIGGLVNCTFESWLFSVGNLGTLPFWTAVFLLLSNQAIQPRRTLYQ